MELKWTTTTSVPIMLRLLEVNNELNKQNLVSQMTKLY